MTKKLNDIKGILFDKDGTLLDFNATWLQPYQRAAAYLQNRFGVVAEAQMLLQRGGFIAETRTWRADSKLASGCNREILDFWSQVIGAPIEGDDQRAIEAIFHLPDAGGKAAVADMPSLFQKLRARGLALGLATMDDEQNARHMLRTHRIDALFDFVCGADSGYGVKPEPGMVHAFCQACALLPKQVMMVGDSPRDLHMGKNAGVACSIGVLSGAHERAELVAHGDYVLENIAGLPKFFDAS